ncbi:hypothetical protein HYQ46_004888 [Verticillium longisporum]|nr:hypothetical protein HYQ46_004888 [Verticillium longisporum]
MTILLASSKRAVVRFSSSCSIFFFSLSTSSRWLCSTAKTARSFFFSSSTSSDLLAGLVEFRPRGREGVVEGSLVVDGVDEFGAQSGDLGVEVGVMRVLSSASSPSGESGSGRRRGEVFAEADMEGSSEVEGNLPGIRGG